MDFFTTPHGIAVIIVTPLILMGLGLLIAIPWFDRKLKRQYKHARYLRYYQALGFNDKESKEMADLRMKERVSLPS